MTKEWLHKELITELAEDQALNTWYSLDDAAQEQHKESRKLAWHEKQEELMGRARAIELTLGLEEPIDWHGAVVATIELPEGKFGRFSHLDAILSAYRFSGDTEAVGYTISWEAYDKDGDPEKENLVRLDSSDVGQQSFRFSNDPESKPSRDCAWERLQSFERSLTAIEEIVFPLQQTVQSQAN